MVDRSSEASNLHILVLPSWYPTRVDPLAGIFFREQVRALQRAGLRTGVAYPDLRRFRSLGSGGWRANRFQISFADEEGIATFRYHGWTLPRVRRWTSRVWIARARQLVERYIEHFGAPHVVHAHCASWAGVAAMSVQARLGIPYLLTEHSSAYARRTIGAWEQALVVDALRSAGALSAVSPAMADMIRPYAGGRPIAITPNLVDMEFFGLPPGPRAAPPFRFLAVGGLKAAKRMDLLIRAFAEAFRGRKDVRLEIGGGGPQRAALDRLAQRLGVREQIEFLGPLNRSQVRDAMWRAHGFVLASPWESFGIALVEAMATGLKVIATSGSGPASFVTPALGRLVPPGRVDSLATALADRVAEGVTAPAEERTIRDQVEERFGEAAFVRTVVEGYRAALGGDRQHGRARSC